MRRVLFVNHLPPGSASCYRQSGLAKYLGRAGFECHFIGRRPAVEERSSPADPQGPEEWPFKSSSFWDEPLVENLRSNLQLFRGQLSTAPLIHVNRANPYTATVVSLGNVPRRPLAVDMEDWDGYGGYSSYASLYGPKGYLLTLYENAFPRLGDIVLAVSRLLKERMRELGVQERRLLLLPNGYDDDRFNPSVRGDAMRDHYSMGDSTVVIYMSTFHRFEADLHKTALAAFKLASVEMPHAKLLMVGGGNLDVRPLIEAAALQERVIYTGRVPREAIPQLIAAADAALHVISNHSYHRASSPMVIPEYMAMGKAIVAPKIGEIAFELSGGAGLLVDRPDPRLLADGIAEVLKNGTLREAISKEAMSRARAKFSYKVLAERLGSAYSRL